MKRLVIIRHAKTEQQNYHQDFNRELLPRGIEDAKKVAQDLKNWNVEPDKILSSSAARAIKTARLMAEVLEYPVERIEQHKGLYFDYTTQDFVDLIQGTPHDVNTLFIIGHNPLIHFVAQNMSKNYDGHMPTCSTVVLDFDVDDWKSVEAREGMLFLHLYPKLYK